MRRKLLFTYIIIITIVMIITAYIGVSTSKKTLNSQISESLLNNLELLSDLFESKVDYSDNESIEEFLTQYSQKIGLRITIVDKDGEVLGDSKTTEEELSNHGSREEILQAAKEGYGNSVRYSQTLGIPCIYYAKKIALDNSNTAFIRISKPLTESQLLQREILNSNTYAMVAVLIISVLLAVMLSYLFAKPIKELTSAVKEVAKGNYDKKIYIDSSDEIGELTNSFNIMSHELKYTISQIEHKNAQLEAILNSMTNGIIAVDKNYRIIMSNQLSLELLELDNELTLTGKSFYDVIRNSNIFDLLEEVNIYEKYLENEFKYGLNNEKILKVHANPIIDKQNKYIIGTVLAIEDVTQIRKLEQMRSDFVSNVTHELKTPLTSIRGFADTLKNGAIEDKNTAMRFLEIIDIEAERLSSLIGEILTLSEIETRNEDINIKKISVKETADEVKELLTPLAQKKGLNFTVEYQPDLEIYCNKERIKQMMINLAENALKYTEKGLVEVKIYSSEGELKMNFKDSGIGIPQESLSRIFERFYRVDKGRSRKMGGTGLGLSIVKHIVMLYKGTISVKSSLGEGTEFEISLPVLAKEDYKQPEKL